MKCPRCGKEIEGKYCPYCGYSGMASGGRGDSLARILINRFKRFLSLTAVISFVAFLLLNIALMIWSVDIILPNTLTNCTIIYIVALVAVPLGSLSGYGFAIYYIFLFVSIFASFILLFYKSSDTLFKNLFKGGGGEKKSSSESQISRLAFVFTALMFIQTSYILILGLFGVSPETPGIGDLELWTMIYNLTRAAVWEEIVVRVVFLGLPMTLYYLGKGKRNIKTLLGGFGLEERFVFWPIMLSSAVFAIAHLAGWDLYKLLPTFIAGLVFGYLFAKDGLHSCIIFHFVWDYISIYDRLPDEMSYMVTTLLFIWMGLGLYFTYQYGRRAVRWLIRPVSGVRKPKGEAREEAEEEGATAGISAGYVCPNCSNNKAIYTKDGKLRCKMCGTESDPLSSESKKGLLTAEKKRQWPPPE